MNNKVNIEELKKNFDPAKGPQTADEWIYLGGDSPNVLNNLVVANLRLANAIARALNNQKDLVNEITDMIDVVTDLKTDLDAVRPADPSSPDKESQIGKTVEEARRLYDRLIAQIDLKPAQKKKFEDDFAKPGGIPELSTTDHQIISQQLQARIQTITTNSQTESSRLQTLTSRYTQASDQASSTLTKDAQSKDKTVSNFRVG
jgi:hypothetical protein